MRCARKIRTSPHSASSITPRPHGISAVTVDAKELNFMLPMRPTGAGGSGSGRGGGGSGAGGIGAQARLLGGNSSRLPSRMLRAFAADRGYGDLLLTVSEAGRGSDCSVLRSTGSGEVDQALCSLMIRRSRWAPARDALGRPISVKLRYTATWSKD